jgi:hypothetical protein
MSTKNRGRREFRLLFGTTSCSETSEPAHPSAQDGGRGGKSAKKRI